MKQTREGQVKYSPRAVSCLHTVKDAYAKRGREDYKIGKIMFPVFYFKKAMLSDSQ